MGASGCTNAQKAPGMVTTTFFSLEDNSKIIFFLSWGFHILATQKNNLYGPGGPNWALGAFWLVLGLEIAILKQFSIKS